MDSRKVSLFATIAVIALVAVGIGFAYTAATSNSDNTVVDEYVTVTQDSTGAYQFAPEGTGIYWDSEDKKVNTGTVQDPVYVYRTKYTLTPTADVNTAIPGHTVVQLGKSFEVKAVKTNGADLASVKCQILPTAFTKPTIEGFDIFMKVTGATENPQYFKLMSDNTFVQMNSTVTSMAGDNQFTIEKYSLASNVETFKTATITLYAGYVGTDANAGIIVDRNTPSAEVVGPAKNILSEAELKFAIHVVGANNPGSPAVSAIALNKASTSIAVSASETLTATVTGSIQTVTWTSSNASVASVAAGVVTGAAAGVAVITATTTEGGIIATCVVTVTAS